MQTELTQALFASGYLDRGFHDEDHAVSAALPDVSLECLLEASECIKVRRVFECERGRSTKAFLSAGMTVCSLEDSEHWLRKSLEEIPSELLPHHQGGVEPLQTKMLGCFSVLDWGVGDVWERVRDLYYGKANVSAMVLVFQKLAACAS